MVTALTVSLSASLTPVASAPVPAVLRWLILCIPSALPTRRCGKLTAGRSLVGDCGHSCAGELGIIHLLLGGPSVGLLAAASDRGIRCSGCRAIGGDRRAATAGDGGRAGAHRLYLVAGNLKCRIVAFRSS